MCQRGKILSVLLYHEGIHHNFKRQIRFPEFSSYFWCVTCMARKNRAFASFWNVTLLSRFTSGYAKSVRDKRAVSQGNERRDDPRKYERKHCPKKKPWIFKISMPPFQWPPRGVMKEMVKTEHFQTFIGSIVYQPVVKLFYNETLNTDRFFFHFLREVVLVTTGDVISTAIQE